MNVKPLIMIMSEIKTLPDDKLHALFLSEVSDCSKELQDERFLYGYHSANKAFQSQNEEMLQSIYDSEFGLGAIAEDLRNASYIRPMCITGFRKVKLRNILGIVPEGTILTEQHPYLSNDNCQAEVRIEVCLPTGELMYNHYEEAIQIVLRKGSCTVDDYDHWENKPVRFLNYRGHILSFETGNFYLLSPNSAIDIIFDWSDISDDNIKVIIHFYRP